MARRVSAALFAAWISCAVAAAADIVPTIPLRAQEARAIVVGSACVQRQGGRTVFLALQPRRALKGRINKWLDHWASMVVFWEAPRLPSGLLDCPYGLWFLRYDRSGDWYVLPARRDTTLLREATLQVPGGEPPLAYRYSPLEPLVDQIAKELWAGVDSGTDELAAVGLEALHGIVRERPDERAPAPFEHWAILDQDHTTTCPVARAAREWDTLVVDRLEDLIVTYHADAVPGLASLLPHIRDASVAPALVRILESGHGGRDVQTKVAATLVRLRVLPALAAIGGLLDRRDRELQWAGVRGLDAFARDIRKGRISLGAEAAGRDEELPDLDPSAFRESPEPLLAFWRSWRDLNVPLAGAVVKESEPAVRPRPLLMPALAPSPPKGRREKLFYRWAGEPGPVGCAAEVVRGKGQLLVTRRPSCPSPEVGRSGYPLTLEVESRLCKGCEAVLRVTLQDAWGGRASVDTRITGR